MKIRVTVCQMLILVICSVGQLSVAGGETFSISGHVSTNGGNPLPDVILDAGPGIDPTVTDATGFYEILVPSGWSGFVSVSKDGWGFDQWSIYYTNVQINLENRDYTAFQPVISGDILDWSRSLRLENVMVSADNGGGLCFTNSIGRYFLTVPYNWSGTVTVSKEDWGFDPWFKTYSNVCGNKEYQHYHAFQPVISGYVRKPSGNGLSGVTVSADSGGDTGVTDSDGAFEFHVPYGWSGTVSVEKAGWLPTSQSYTDIITDQTNQTFNVEITDIVVRMDGEGDFTSIQDAIFASNSETPYHTIILHEGIYVEDIYCYRSIILRSTDPDNSQVVANTIIDGNYLDTVVRLQSEVICTLAGLTIRNGLDNNGGGIIGGSASSTLENCVIENCRAGYGGGVYGFSGAILECTITGNSSTHEGGGLYNCNGTIINSTISNNSASYDGGGLHDCDAEINNCVIMNNTASVNGGGLSGCDGEIIDCTIANNTASENGGGLYEYHGGMIGCTVTNNSGDNGAGLHYCDMEIRYSVITNNNALYTGGGLFNCDGDIFNCIISDNLAYSGGGLFGCDGNITGCTIVDNSVSYDWGAMYACNGFIGNCIIWGNGINQLYLCSIPDYCCIQDWNGGGIENISADPLLAADGYHLTMNSPCINAGDSAYLYNPGDVDIDDEIRLAGGRIDIGVDEYWSASPIMYIDPNSLQFSALENRINPTAQVITLSNPCLLPLSWDITAGADWAQPSPENGSLIDAGKDITINIDTTGLSAGLHQCDLTIASPEAINSPIIIPISLELIGPKLVVDNNAFSFQSYPEQLTPEPQILVIQNAVDAGGTLNWQINIPPDCAWLTATPFSGQSATQACEVQLIVDATDLAFNDYTCEFIISDPRAADSPQTVTVTLNHDGPSINISPMELTLEAPPGYSHYNTGYFSINNTGQYTLEWEVLVPTECSWLSVSPTQGASTGENDTVQVFVDTTELEVGEYTCELTITDPDAQNNPVVLPVTLEVYTPSEIYVPDDYPTLSEAIDTARDTDIIILAPGEYVSNYNVMNINKIITLRSENPDNPTVVAATVIRHGFYFERDVTLDGLTIKHIPGVPHYSYYGVMCYEKAEIRNCIIRDMVCGYPALVCYGDGSVIANCVITNNTGLDYKYAGGGVACSGDQCTISNTLIVQNSAIQLSLSGDNSSVENCTIFHSPMPLLYGSYSSGRAVAFVNGNYVVKNSIIWSNSTEDANDILLNAYSDPVNVNVSYSCIKGGMDTFELNNPELCTINWGPGNLIVDPGFVLMPDDSGDGWWDDPYTPDVDESANNIPGDFHLKSQTGRWRWSDLLGMDLAGGGYVNLQDVAVLAAHWNETETTEPADIDGDGSVGLTDLAILAQAYLGNFEPGWWEVDDVTSPCVDAGDPASDATGELWPHCKRINMGAYGGTGQASLSTSTIGHIADLNHDGQINLLDVSRITALWMGDRFLAPENIDQLGDVDITDLTYVIDAWLWQETVP